MRQNLAEEAVLEDDFEFSAEDIELLLANIDSYTPEEQEEHCSKHWMSTRKSGRSRLHAMI
jgi:hypothetical protein